MAKFKHWNKSRGAKMKYNNNNNDDMERMNN